MLRAMYSGISGLRNFQTKLDVIGNNIANVNTVGFKASRVMFKDILSQTVQGASGPGANRGGTNPKQIGLGSTIGSIDTIFTTGGYMTTNVATDLLINGDGFFVVAEGTFDAQNNFTVNKAYLTRAGNFTFDKNGNLVTSDGYLVLANDGSLINIANINTAKNINIASDGSVTYLDGNGVLQTAGIIGVAKVANPAGLEKVGDSLYVETPNSGAANVSQPGQGGTGTLVSGVLEMSNVDLANEFTEMIVAQRAFQANTRIITASDEVLQELVNMKR